MAEEEKIEDKKDYKRIVHEFDDEALRFLEGKYIFRFPFTIGAIRWGLIMGGLFSVNKYIQCWNTMEI